MASQRCFRIETPRVVHETFGDEVVIIEFETGSYYSLDNVGSQIWNLIERGSTVESIVAHLASVYRGSRSGIQDAVQQFTAELQEQRLISPTQAGPVPELGVTSAEFDEKPESERREFEPPTLQKYTDMQELLVLDPIHEVDETGWPNVPPETPAR